MTTGRKVIEQLTGIKPADTDSIFAQVKANSAKLNSCGYHEFVEMPGQEDKVFGKRYHCTRCGGEVDCHAFYWHKQGRRSKP